VPLSADNDPQTVCPRRDTVTDIWEADPSIFCGVCQAEVVTLFIVGDRIKRIEFQGTGCMVG
jgi:hypothetical protein